MTNFGAQIAISVSQCINDKLSKIFNILWLPRICRVFDTPQTQKSIAVMSRDPIKSYQLSGNVLCKKFRTAVAKWDGDQSCRKYKLLKSGRGFNAAKMTVFSLSG